jgi:hypothetical protein
LTFSLQPELVHIHTSVEYLIAQLSILQSVVTHLGFRPLQCTSSSLNFPLIFSQFLYKHCHPDVQISPSTLKGCPAFDGMIKVHHSAVATFYAPSDLSGLGGLQFEQIQSTPCFFGHPCRDTVFVITDNSQPGMEGMEIRCVQLFFSFQYQHQEFSCALINWFVHTDEHDPDTGMWTVTQEHNHHGKPTSEVIHIAHRFNCSSGAPFAHLWYLMGTRGFQLSPCIGCL